MPLLHTKTSIDLTGISEVDLVTELHNRDISLDYIEGAYYSLEEQETHRLDASEGDSEYGLHGRNAK
jgi:hypothetical protein